MPRFDRILAQTRFTEHTVMALCGVVIGILGGLGALGFKLLIKIGQYLFYGPGHDLLEIAQGLPTYHKIIAPVVGGFIVGPIIYYLAREAKGHGVPEVMESIVIRGGVIRPRVVLIKALASATSIGSGGSVGREGPIVQIGSALASTFGQILKVSGERMRTFVGCGAAAGIAATFNAPIAGALFSLEIVLGDWGISRFTPIVISSVMATVVTRHFKGNFPTFEAPSYEMVSPLELGPYIILGLLVGLVGWIFIVVLYRSEDIFDASPLPEQIRPALGGLLVGSLGIFWPHVLGVGYESINLALDGQMVWGLMGALIIIKMLATSLTIGSGHSGGIFTPCLFMGAMTGGLFGYYVHSLFPAYTASSGAYALVAMGAMVAATTQAPITAIIIVFELTRSYTIILPLMTACIVANIVSVSLSRESIYTLKLARRGLSIVAGREVSVMKALRVNEVMTDRMRTFYEGTPLSTLLDEALSSPYSYFPVVDGNGHMTGIFSLQDLRMVLMEDMATLGPLVVARDIATTDGLITVTPEDDLDLVFQKFGQKNIEEIPVVSPEEPSRVIAMVRRKDVIEAYNKEILRRTATQA